MSVSMTQEHSNALIQIMNDQAGPNGYGLVQRAMANDLSLRGLIKTNAAIQTETEIAAKLTEAGANFIHAQANNLAAAPAKNEMAPDSFAAPEQVAPQAAAEVPYSPAMTAAPTTAAAQNVPSQGVRSDVPMPVKTVRRSDHDYNYAALVTPRVDSIHVPLKFSTDPKTGKEKDNFLAVYAAVNRHNEQFATVDPTGKTRIAKNGETVPEKVYSRQYKAVRVTAEDPEGKGARIYRII